MNAKKLKNTNRLMTTHVIVVISRYYRALSRLALSNHKDTGLSQRIFLKPLIFIETHSMFTIK